MTAAMLAAAASWAPAQVVGAGDQPPAAGAEMDPYEGRPVRRIVIERLDAPEGESQIAPDLATLARNQLRLREGTPFSKSLVSEDVSRLNRLGRFMRVESRVQLLGDGSVDVFYRLAVQRVVEDIQTVGNKKVSDQDLLKMVDVLTGTPVDLTQIDRAARRIEARYRELGYYSARVTVDEDELAKTGIVVLVVREGERTKVSVIKFEGNLSYAAAELKRQIKTKEAWLLESGPLDNDRLADDVASLILFYRNRGYLDIRADKVVTPSPNGREAIVTYVIDEGPVYTLRSVKITPKGQDEGVFSAEQILALMTIKPGDVYSDDAVRKSLEEVFNAYGKLGYVDVRVGRFELRDPEEPRVDLEIDITSGRRFQTGQVIVRGNTLTQDKVVRRHVTHLPDRPLDATQTEETKRRLRGQRLFDPRPEGVQVTVQPEDPENPGYRDVLVEVKETNTGEINFGGAVSSDLGLSARISLKQRNFDITNVPGSWDEVWNGEAFRGGGQTFDILLQPGSQFSNYALALGEPYLFETDYSGGASVYFRTRDWNAYTEQRVGTQWSVGRRFGERWSASVPLKAEAVQLSDIEPDSPTDYFESEDQKLLTSLGLTLSRSTLDDPFMPSKGSVVTLALEQFAAPGDYTFSQARLDYKRYFKIDEDFMGRRTTLLLNTSVAYIPQDTDDVPFYERSYLGGRNFRGFGVRAVAPKGVRQDNGQVSDDTIGGNFLFFLGAEIQRPLFEDILSGVVFIDTGTVNPEPSLDNYRVSVGVGLRFNIPMLSPAPLAFDFGFPILKEDGDKTRLFTFSLDIPFK
ncbi:MAG: outer membrane protein assembly factor BamA [Phycisphaerales bacterium]|nr:outer membrane protein assembly factor BamA [Phycisphaerales bacterium]